MKVLIDADACPVVDITVRLCEKHGVRCVIVCDTSHFIERGNAETVTVDKSADSADFKIVNMLSEGDIAVTQDYGLAAMCLARSASAVNQNGLIYTDKNIEKLLYTRFVSKKIRMSGGRTRGQKKRTPEQDREFEISLERLLSSGDISARGAKHNPRI